MELAVVDSAVGGAVPDRVIVPDVVEDALGLVVVLVAIALVIVVLVVVVLVVVVGLVDVVGVVVLVDVVLVDEVVFKITGEVVELLGEVEVEE